MLTEKQMITIIENKQIDQCTDEEKAQVMSFAFGDEFMASESKGDKKTYKPLCVT
jgi:hypothetical protein